MKKNMKKLLSGVLIGSVLMSSNVWAQDIPDPVSEEASADAVSPRITVGKYVEVEKCYALMADVPEYYYYSYYDLDYKTTLKGYLELIDTIPYPTEVVATFGGYCCGSI